MLKEIRRGKVMDVKEEYPGLQIIEVTEAHSNHRSKAVVYPELTGDVETGDEVWLNTTAVKLSLGTGGYHFVSGIIGREEQELSGPGHIMKMRYTPWQIKVMSVEEEDSPHHIKIKDFKSLEGTPVIVGTLHSMIVPALLAYTDYYGTGAGIIYIMTDGAALPASFSHLLHRLKQKKLVRMTVTCGHAFGGDLEAVNIYSALAAAKSVGDADLIMVSMGPGIVGTGTPWGFSGIEQAFILEAVERLEGRPVAVPRISFADSRERHRGLSHHSRTVLGKLTYARAVIGIPYWKDERDLILAEQIRQEKLEEKHHLYSVNVPPVNEIMKSWDMEIKTMGRSYQEDPSFFDTAAVAGLIAAEFSKTGNVESLPWSTGVTHL